MEIFQLAARLPHGAGRETAVLTGTDHCRSVAGLPFEKGLDPVVAG